MTAKRRKTVYGIGCITIKNTHPGRGDQYVYTEWSVEGKHHYKSCGNANNPDSRKRAMSILRGVAITRMKAILAEAGRIQAALDADEAGRGA